MSFDRKKILMMNLDVLKNLDEPIFYVTNDVGKGIGLEEILPNYHIVCLDDHPLVDILEKKGVSIFCLERALGSKNVIFRSSGIILDNPSVLAFIKEKSKSKKANILFFKPQKKIEIIAKRENFNLLGNSTSLGRFFEDKIEFFKLCQKEKLPVYEGEITTFSGSNFGSLTRKYGEVLVIQFGRGWAGNSTFFVSSEQEWKDLRKKFGGIQIKVGRFIKGRTVLNNAVIFANHTLISEPAIQIKSNRILTSVQAATGGRQWPAGLTSGQTEEIREITLKVAGLMKDKGYRGFFGLDFLVEKKTGKIFLSEDNARLTASVPFYTKLELREKAFPLLGYHLLSFLSPTENEEVDCDSVSVSGAEIVARNTLETKVKVGGILATGIYTKELVFKAESSYLSSKEREDFWLETAAKGRIVNPEIEIARINTYAPVCDNEGNLRNDYLKLIETIKERLKLEKC